MLLYWQYLYESQRRELQCEGKTYYLATGPRTLPQGSPASPALTNALCLRLDRRLSQYAINNKWRYTRYADDLTFSRLDDGSPYGSIKPLLSMLHVVTKEELQSALKERQEISIAKVKHISHRNFFVIPSIFEIRKDL